VREGFGRAIDFKEVARAVCLEYVKMKNKKEGKWIF